MSNQVKNNNLVNTKIELIKDRALDISKSDKIMENFLRLQSCQPKAVVEKIEIDPEKIFFYTFNSDLGKITLFTDKSRVLAIDFDKLKPFNPYIIKNFPRSELKESKTKCQYFFEKLFYSKEDVSIKAGIKGSDFSFKILLTLSQTRPGDLVSYKSLGEKAGFFNSQRAVGSAMKNNPIPYLIPCHRVIKSDLRLGFYSGGTERKIIYILRENNYSIPKNISAF